MDGLEDLEKCIRYLISQRICLWPKHVNSLGIVSLDTPNPITSYIKWCLGGFLQPLATRAQPCRSVPCMVMWLSSKRHLHIKSSKLYPTQAQKVHLNSQHHPWIAKHNYTRIVKEILDPVFPTPFSSHASCPTLSRFQQQNSPPLHPTPTNHSPSMTSQ